MKNIIIFVFTISAIACATSCKHDNGNAAPDDGNYPAAVAKIIVAKCATAGCHNTQSMEAASGLDLSTWDKLFNGNHGGAVVIPYSIEQSPLLYFVNTDSALGMVQTPRMPSNSASLTTAEYVTLRDWIANGAPDKSGNIYFAPAAGQKKYYIANQGCDLVAVCDPARRVIARYITIGNKADVIETPHTIKMSPDGLDWYAVFYNSGTVFQKFSTYNDSLVGSVTIPDGWWASIAFTADSRKAYITDNQPTHDAILTINLQTMTQEGPYYAGLYPNAHGIAINPKNGWLYVTNDGGGYSTKADTADLTSTDPVLHYGWAHEILFSPDSSKYFITGDGITDNKLRIFDALTDSLMATIPAGEWPKEMSLSLKHPYLFVTCMQTGNSNSKYKGSVLVVNYLTNQVVKEITDGFYQPHGIAVNDDDDVVYVASSNVNPTGPPPHHVSVCGGRNGFLSIIDMNTLSLVPGYKNELSVFPYSVFYKK